MLACTGDAVSVDIDLYRVDIHVFKPGTELFHKRDFVRQPVLRTRALSPGMISDMTKIP